MATSGQALQYVAESLRGDLEVALAAVLQDGLALQHAAASARDSHEIVYVAVQNTGAAIQYSSDRLLEKKEIALTAMKNSPQSLHLLPITLKRDFEVVYTAACVGLKGLEPLALKHEEVGCTFFDTTGTCRGCMGPCMIRKPGRTTTSRVNCFAWRSLRCRFNSHRLMWNSKILDFLNFLRT